MPPVQSSAYYEELPLVEKAPLIGAAENLVPGYLETRL